jgi:hypothetical protein
MRKDDNVRHFLPHGGIIGVGDQVFKVGQDIFFADDFGQVFDKVLCYQVPLLFLPVRAIKWDRR